MAVVEVKRRIWLVVAAVLLAVTMTVAAPNAAFASVSEPTCKEKLKETKYKVKCKGGMSG